jgi:plastocyanin
MSMSRSSSVVVLAALAGAAGAACGGSASGPTGAPLPAVQKAAASSGDGQTGTVGTALANPLRVLVTLSGAPQAGDTVTWAAVGSGASVSPTKSISDASGIATTTWTLGQAAGGQVATATLRGATGSPTTFLATAQAGAATQLSLFGGENQSGSPNAVLSAPLTVKAADQFGNGASGAAVAWQVTGGAGAVNPVNAVSGATGLAQTVLTLGGTAGPVTVTASGAALAGSPVTFHATVVPLGGSAAVQIGNFFFTSSRNGTSNPAVDTIAAGGTVTWTWAGGSHGVESTGSPSFANSTTKTTGTYAFTFSTPGTYTYDCVVHGAAMTGRVVVQ